MKDRLTSALEKKSGVSRLYRPCGEWGCRIQPILFFETQAAANALEQRDFRSIQSVSDGAQDFTSLAEVL
jgi:hypothetical protein